ncbi:MAG: Uma2 family endonuclease, partial [Lachnospiraceae bacterium]|nr:Uma2 family endonuclease [Lachnospiraceae bacterium]
GYLSEGKAEQRTGGYSSEGKAEQRTGGYSSEGKAEQRTSGYSSEGKADPRTVGYLSEGKAEQRTGGYSSEGKTEQRTGGYLFEGSSPSLVSEALAEYGVSRQQGEYTLEDYLAWPKEQRVELIDGVIYDMAAPTLIHQAIGGRLYTVFSNFITGRQGSCMAFISPVDVQLDCDDKTIVEPDVLIICDPSKLHRERIYGAPDFVAEVLSPSTSRKDRFLKLSKYRRAGVREYWLIDPDRKKVMVYEFAKSDSAKIYGFSDRVPVGIYNGECQVDFAEIYRQIAFLYDTM